MSVADTDTENESADVPLMQKAAIEIAARKIASGGDLRKALDICRYSLILFKSLGEQLNLLKQKRKPIKVKL